jgi:mRNA interferase MazF
MYKEFDKWNLKKKKVDKKFINKDLFFYPKEIWWSSLGLNIGIETNGKNDNFERPVLIIKKFNSNMLWVLPLTTKVKIGPNYFNLNNDNNSSVIFTQIRTISTKRLLRKISTITDTDYENIINNIISILKNENTLLGVISEANATNNNIVSEKSFRSN